MFEKSNAVLIIEKYKLVGKKIIINEDEALFRKYFFDYKIQQKIL